MTTQHLNREVEAAVAEKATPIKPGVWRNLWKFHCRVVWPCGKVDLPGELLEEIEWPSREFAEQKGNDAYSRMLAQDPDLGEYLTYVGPVFVANTDNQGDGA